MRKDFGKKLWDAALGARKALKPFLQHRRDVLRVIGGKHYGEGSPERYPVNRIKQAYDIYTRLLAGRYPTVTIRTQNPEMKWRELADRQRLTDLMKEINFQHELRLGVHDAISLYGIFKAGLGSTDKADFEDWEQDPGQPFVKRVSPDDFLFDVYAQSWEAVQFAGDRVIRDMEFVLDSGMYDVKHHDAIRQQARQYRDNGTMDPASKMSRGTNLRNSDLYDRVMIWEFYLPREQTILSVLDGGGQVIREQEYDGPEDGLFEMLSFSEMPDNLLPVAPSMDWVDLNDSLNYIFRKFQRQAQRQKTVGVGRKEDEKSIAEIRNASDGHVLSLQAPDAFREQSIGGIDQKNMGFFAMSENILNGLQGNRDLAGGMAPSADTAAQEKMLGQNASAMIDDMQSAVELCVEKLLRRVLWYDIEDPVSVRNFEVKVEGVEIPVPVELQPFSRDHDYSLEIVPGSMRPRNASAMVNEMMRFVGQILMPMAPLLQQQGMNINMDKIIRFYSEKSDMPELAELLDIANDDQLQQQAQHGGGQYMPTKPPTSRREYVRTQQSSPQQQNAADMAMEMMNQSGE